MNRAWTPVTVILTVVTVVLAVIFFVATQKEVTGRDWIVLSLGIAFGAALTSVAATLTFHSDRRRNALRAETAYMDRKRELLAALPTRGERVR